MSELLSRAPAVPLPRHPPYPRAGKRRALPGPQLPCWPGARLRAALARDSWGGRCPRYSLPPMAAGGGGTDAGEPPLCPYTSDQGWHCQLGAVPCDTGPCTGVLASPRGDLNVPPQPCVVVMEGLVLGEHQRGNGGGPSDSGGRQAVLWGSATGLRLAGQQDSGSIFPFPRPFSFPFLSSISSFPPPSLPPFPSSLPFSPFPLPSVSPTPSLQLHPQVPLAQGAGAGCQHPAGESPGKGGGGSAFPLSVPLSPSLSPLPSVPARLRGRRQPWTEPRPGRAERGGGRAARLGGFPPAAAIAPCRPGSAEDKPALPAPLARSRRPTCSRLPGSRPGQLAAAGVRGSGARPSPPPPPRHLGGCLRPGPPRGFARQGEEKLPPPQRSWLRPSKAASPRSAPGMAGGAAGGAF